MKKYFLTILLSVFLTVTHGAMLVSAQGSIQFTGCVQGELAGITGCVCMNTATNQLTIVAGSYCSAAIGGTAGGGQLLSLLGLAQTIVNRLVPFLIGLAIVVFFWYLVMYIWKGDESADARQKGLHGMAYSIIAIFVMVSIWGIIIFISNTLGIGIGGGLKPLEMPQVR